MGQFYTELDYFKILIHICKASNQLVIFRQN